MKLHNILTLAVAGVLATSVTQAQPANIALGKTATFNTPPNYKLCSDPEDSLQLTDGVVLSETYKNSLWTNKGTVGWASVNPAIITLDLGKVQPISGAALSTAKGPGGVVWPSAIHIAVSEDAKNWNVVGDLVQLSAKPPEGEYLRYRFESHALKTKGRYVAFAVVNKPFIFAEEIEVYSGDAAYLDAPVGGETSNDLAAYVSARHGIAPPVTPDKSSNTTASDNIAAGKTVTFNATPNYPLCTDPDDAKQLTDGKYATAGVIWVDKATVGWKYTNPVVITVDLTTAQTISGISFGTAAGSGGVKWPTSIKVAVSSDNQTWENVGDLVALSAKNGTPPVGVYAAFRYSTRDLNTKGRYVAFTVESAPFTFVDEIEVFVAR